jgi:Family of unknown function (DUF6221)
VTGRRTDKRSLVDLLSFLFDRLDDDEAAARARLTPATFRRDATPGGPARAFRELAAKRSMVAMWFDGVQADLSRPPVAGLNVADAMIMALVTVYADHPLFDPGWLADLDPPEPTAAESLDNVVELRPGRP